MNPWNIIGWVIVFGLILTAYAAATYEPPDYEARANCIAEYDYQHPRRSQMNNLVISLKKCQ